MMFRFIILIFCTSLCMHLTALTPPDISDREANYSSRTHSIPGGDHFPEFFIIGAQKCATTSLYDLFVTHPSICRSYAKEVHYFDRPDNWEKGSRHYAAFFNNAACSKKLRRVNEKAHYMDSTPDYFYSRMVPPRMYKSFSKDERHKKKFILVLREPVDREYSFYNHRARFCTDSMREYIARHRSVAQKVKSGTAKWDTAELCAERHCLASCQAHAASARFRHEVDAIANFTQYWQDGDLLPMRSAYVEHLEHWLKFFKRKQFFVVNMATLLINTTDTVERMTRFLGIPAFPEDSYRNGTIVLPHDNSARVETKYDCAVRNALFPYYEPYNQRLYERLKERAKVETYEPPFPEFVQKTCAPGQLY